MHIGSLIREQLREDGHSVTWFARQINCTRANAYNIFRKSSLDTDLLKRISKVFNHDFFKDISRSL